MQLINIWFSQCLLYFIYITLILYWVKVGRCPPEMEQDVFWEESVPKELPYTREALPFRHETDTILADKAVEKPAQLFTDSSVMVMSGLQSNLSSLKKISSSMIRKLSNSPFPSSNSNSYEPQNQKKQESSNELSPQGRYFTVYIKFYQPLHW